MRYRKENMFDKGKISYKSDIELGRRYRDEQTGIIGIAAAIGFYQYACERVTIELVIQGEIREFVFDAPRLVSVETGVQATTEKTGGPRAGIAQASMPGR